MNNKAKNSQRFSYLYEYRSDTMTNLFQTYIHDGFPEILPTACDVDNGVIKYEITAEARIRFSSFVCV